MYALKNGRIIIRDEPFDPGKIAESGQVFRYEKIGETYRFYSGDKMCLASGNGLRGEITFPEGRESWAGYFADYFNLGLSYRKINKSFRERETGSLMENALRTGRGIRILRQDKFETLISFILSSNNNIPRIKMIIQRLCESLGENRGIYRAFPGPEKMAAQSESFYRDRGCGYRSPWVLGAARRILRENGPEAGLEAYSSLPTGALQEALQRFDGVGPKVADCIALFAYNRWEVFPVDTWVKKIYRRWFGSSPGVPVMRKDLAGKFGPYAGIAQQYLFYYYRNQGPEAGR